MNKEMTSLERVLASLSHKEPDRVPMFLLLTMHGAKELGMSIKKYFSKAEHVIEGQTILQEKYKNDCYYPFFYAPLEIEAFGGKVIYSEDGPPNSGMPFISDIEQIKKLEAPKVEDTVVLHKVLRAIEVLKKTAQDKIPIIGVVMSPFSLPVMQMGFDHYLNIMHDRKDLFDKLMEVNKAFCIDWANAQLNAGATAICYFDPVSSTTIVTRDMYLETGFEIAKETIAGINGPTATHFASGNALPIVADVAQTGTAVLGISSKEDLGALKEASRNKISLLGNLNGIEMRTWTVEQTHDIVKAAIQQAAPGGGFILSDNHGEIPYQVPDEIIKAISDAVLEYGRYPIK